MCAEQGASVSFWLLSDTVPWLAAHHSSTLPQIHWLFYFRQNVQYLPLLMILLWCKCERNVQVWILGPRHLVALFLKCWKTLGGVLEGCGTFRRKILAGGSEPLRVAQETFLAQSFFLFHQDVRWGAPPPAAHFCHHAIFSNKDCIPSNYKPK